MSKEPIDIEDVLKNSKVMRIDITSESEKHFSFLANRGFCLAGFDRVPTHKGEVTQAIFVRKEFIFPNYEQFIDNAIFKYIEYNKLSNKLRRFFRRNK